MDLYVGVTDWDWFQLHAQKPRVEEVNFWRPSSDKIFKRLRPGELFLFKLHAPRNFIAGGGFFSKFLPLPVSLAWEAFGEGNGARSLEEVRNRISRYRREPIPPGTDPVIGCILIEEPFFWPKEQWIACPESFRLNTVQGKGYPTEEPEGKRLWELVRERLQQTQAALPNPGPALVATVEGARYGAPTVTLPRLGQGSFRILVADAYNRRCSMTQERTLPVLEAAHIRPFAAGGEHHVDNGILLRSDLHVLFDRGYLGVDPGNHRILVSPRIKEQFENGRHYYALAGGPMALPPDPQNRPAQEHLLYHAEKIFR